MKNSIQDQLKPDFCHAGQVIIAVVLLTALYFISLNNYLFFHSIVELAGIAVAYAIFIIVWNTRKTITNTFFLIVGISFLFTGTIDLIHTLAYRGMGVFPGTTADLATQLWIAARYFQSITFLVAALFIGRSITKNRTLDTGIIVAACTAASGALLAGIMVWHIFPSCFIDGSGLTPFKIISEYIISLILIATAVIIFYKRQFFEREVWHYLIAAQIFLILGELAFTSYISVYGFTNMLGHLFRLISVYLFYRAFVVVGLTRPFDLLFRELRQKTESLQESEERFRRVFETLPIGLWLADKNGTFLMGNPAGQKIWGEEHLVGREEYGIFRAWRLPSHEPVAPGDWALGYAVSEGRETNAELLEIEAFDGTHKFILNWAAPVKNEAGEITGAFVINQDITERRRFEEALQSEKDLWQKTFDSIPDLIAIIDKDHRIVRINKAMADRQGIRPEDARGSFCYKGVHGTSEPPLYCPHMKLLRDGKVHTADVSLPLFQGEFQITVSPLFNADGSIFGSVHVVHDITDRIQAQDQLQFANTVLSTQIESSPDAILVVDEAGKIILYNRQFIRLWAIPPEIIALQSDERALQWVLDKLADPDGFLAGVQHLYRHRDEKSRDEVVLRDGRILDRYSAPMSGTDGKYYGRLWTFRDISGRKRVERELHLLAADLRSIINNAPAMIWYKDTQNNFVRANPAAAHAFGLAINEIEGKSAYDLFPDMAEKYYQDDLEVIHSGTPKINIIEQMQIASGKTLWVQTDKIPLKDDHGEVTGVLVFVVDITERKRTEDALELASKKLNLLSSITRHDILNQLMVLLGNLEMVYDDVTGPEDREFIEHSMMAAKTIQRQIEFTREYQELGVKAPVWLNVHTCIRQAMASLPLRDIRVSTDLPDLEVYADPLFVKVFYNLTDNALRYGGNQMTSVSVTAHEEGPAIVILFEDNGAGISEEDKKKLFTKGFGKHTGLGLFLSREILSITGITITENGIPGKGARFEINVPKDGYRFLSPPE
jgi:PAS domain S-box